VIANRDHSRCSRIARNAVQRGGTKRHSACASTPETPANGSLRRIGRYGRQGGDVRATDDWWASSGLQAARDRRPAGESLDRTSHAGHPAANGDSTPTGRRRSNPRVLPSRDYRGLTASQASLTLLESVRARAAPLPLDAPILAWYRRSTARACSRPVTIPACIALLHRLTLPVKPGRPSRPRRFQDA
jgi:hypothetical protein